MKSVKYEIYVKHCKYIDCFIDRQIIKEIGYERYNYLARNLYAPMWGQIVNGILIPILDEINHV